MIYQPGTGGGSRERTFSSDSISSFAFSLSLTMFSLMVLESHPACFSATWESTLGALLWGE